MRLSGFLASIISQNAVKLDKPISTAGHGKLQAASY
jgi:hypothetical protein